MRLFFHVALFLAPALLIVVPRPVLAHGRDQTAVRQIYQDEGNTGIIFNVACTSSSWTAVPTSSDTIRRAIIYQGSFYAVAEVCLSTMTLAADPCVDSSAGLHISTGSTLTDYSGINFKCRANSTGNVNVHGYWTRDTGDYGLSGDSR